jgi:VanZ family protein
MQRSDNVKYWIEIVLWMCFIFWMSTNTFSAANTSRIIEPLIRFFVPSISTEMLTTLHAFIRKCAHLTEYMVLGLLLFRAMNASGMQTNLLKTAAYSLLIVMCFAATDELHQVFVASRTPSPVDVAIDSTGGLISQCFMYLWYRRRQVRELTNA